MNSNESKNKSNKPIIRVKVVGVGGGGNNAISRMYDDFARGVESIAINTDIQDLDHCKAKRKIHIGPLITKGMGAGMNPDLGRQSAEENRSEIAEALKDADMVFLTAGFGGGTGTGALPVVAEIAKSSGALTIAVITKPFSFEGSTRMKIAEEGINNLRGKVDTLLVIPNDRIFSIIDNDTPMLKAFEKIDDILRSAVQGITEIITSAGLVNVDFADVKAIMGDAGTAIVGAGIASGPGRAVKAVSQVMNSPLLETSVAGAKGVLFCVAGGRDLKMSEINESAKIINENVDPEAKIIFGAYNDRKLKAGQIKIILIATGFNSLPSIKKEPDSLNLFNPGEKSSNITEKSSEEEVKEESKEDKLKKVFNRDDQDNENDEDFWDIPAFLRKRRK
jgi:cell division protein FtsZ